MLDHLPHTALVPFGAPAFAHPGAAPPGVHPAGMPVIPHPGAAAPGLHPVGIVAGQQSGSVRLTESRRSLCLFVITETMF